MAEQSVAQASFGWGNEPHLTRVAEERIASRSVATRDSAPSPVTQVERFPGKGSDLPLPPDNELWDVRAAAKFLKRSVSWVYHKAEDGTLPVRRLDGWGVRFVPAELRAWVVERGAGRGRRR
jgi:predicted DNA-binding transcriptional regulator AlpA